MKKSGFLLIRICIFYVFIILPKSKAVCQHTSTEQIRDTIVLINPSFEGKPARGGEYPWNLRGWKDFGSLLFENESPPDIHPNNYWRNNQAPSHGLSYVGLVGRIDGSYEAISQTIWKLLKTGSTYEFSLDMCIPSAYYSPVRSNFTPEGRAFYDEIFNFNNPAKINIEGLTQKGRRTLLDSSQVVDHTDWRKYTFILKPDEDVSTIILSIGFATKNPQYCAMLIDNASDIIEISEDSDIKK